jgi:hypothetical protein
VALLLTLPRLLLYGLPLLLLALALELLTLAQALPTPSLLARYGLELRSYHWQAHPEVHQTNPYRRRLPLLVGLWLETLGDYLLRGAERPRDYPEAPLSWAAAQRRGRLQPTGSALLQRGGLLLLALLGSLLLGGLGAVAVCGGGEGAQPEGALATATPTIATTNAAITPQQPPVQSAQPSTPLGPVPIPTSGWRAADPFHGYFGNLWGLTDPLWHFGWAPEDPADPSEGQRLKQLIKQLSGQLLRQKKAGERLTPATEAWTLEQLRFARNHHHYRLLLQQALEAGLKPTRLGLVAAVDDQMLEKLNNLLSQSLLVGYRQKLNLFGTVLAQRENFYGRLLSVDHRGIPGLQLLSARLEQLLLQQQLLCVVLEQQQLSPDCDFDRVHRLRQSLGSLRHQQRLLLTDWVELRQPQEDLLKLRQQRALLEHYGLWERLEQRHPLLHNYLLRQPLELELLALLEEVRYQQTYRVGPPTADYPDRVVQRARLLQECLERLGSDTVELAAEELTRRSLQLAQLRTELSSGLAPTAEQHSQQQQLLRRLTQGGELLQNTLDLEGVAAPLLEQRLEQQQEELEQLEQLSDRLEPLQRNPRERGAEAKSVSPQRSSGMLRHCYYQHPQLNRPGRSPRLWSGLPAGVVAEGVGPLPQAMARAGWPLVRWEPTGAPTQPAQLPGFGCRLY